MNLLSYLAQLGFTRAPLSATERIIITQDIKPAIACNCGGRWWFNDATGDWQCNWCDEHWPPPTWDGGPIDRNPNSPEQFSYLLLDQQEQLLSWIAQTFMPARRGHPRIKSSSYGLKHEFERSPGGWYLYNGAFKGAMLASGYKSIDPEHEINWRFNAARRVETRPADPTKLARQDLTDFDRLEPEQQAKLIAWCKEYFDPRPCDGIGGVGRWSRTWSAYGGFAVSPGALAGAFRAAGFEVRQRAGAWYPRCMIAANCLPARTRIRPDLILMNPNYPLQLGRQTL